MKKTFEPRAHAKTLALLGVAVFLVSMIAVSDQASAAPALNLVQVGLQTSLSYPYQYSLTAYNTSGYQVASYESSFPGAALQLPSGTYLLTASAYYQNSTICYDCVMSAGAGSSSGAAIAPIIRPYGNQATEYGYSLITVSGQTNLAITLRNASALPMTQLTIHVGYANGTAAADASVSGYVVGSYYVYSPKELSYGQTDEAGDVTLTMPQAPVDVSAYLSMPIKLPRNTSTLTVNVGGQKVNVTVYLQPSYLSLSGEALILPPQTSASIVLQYQPENFPIVYAGAPTTAGAGASLSSAGTAQSTPQTSTSTSQTQATTRIAPFDLGGSGVPLITSSQSSTGSESSAGTSNAIIEVAAVGAALVVAIAVSVFFVRKTQSGAPPA